MQSIVRTLSALLTVSVLMPIDLASALPVSLTVQELLPADDAGGYPPQNIPGRLRVQEPVTSGVPLSDGDGITSVNQLAVESISAGVRIPAQFRVLNRYPSGNIQWVLVDLQADVPASSWNTDLRLIAGVNPAAADPALAQDSGAAISIATGAANFTVRKANQNLLDSAVIGITPLLTSGHSGGILYTDSTGTLYTSAQDPSSTAVIEENGPLKAVIKEQGRLVTSGGGRSLGYTVRLTFFRNTTYIKSHVSIENGFRDSLTRKSLGSLRVSLPLTLGTGRQFLFARQSDTLTGSLGGAETAYLYQGRTTHKGSSLGIAVSGRVSPFQEENDWGANFTGTSDTGFTIVHQANVLHPFQGTAAYSRGFGDLADGTGRGLSVAMRDFDSFYPSGLEFTGAGNVSVELWSAHNTAPAMTFNWGAHDSRDVVFDFHAGTGDPLLTHYRAQYPLFARAPFTQYRDTGAMLGRKTLLTYQEMQDYHQSNTAGLGLNQWSAGSGGIFGFPTYTLPNQQIVRVRSYYWGEGGRQTNNDYTVPKLLGFLQTGGGGLYQTAYNFIHFIADQAIHHSDRDTWTIGQENSVTGPTEPYAVGQGGQFSQFETDMEHENVIGVPLLYYLTGDESIRDALIDHEEWLGIQGSFTSTCRPGARDVSQRLKWHSIFSDIFGDSTEGQRSKVELDKLVDNMLCATISNPADTTDLGWDMDRGYLFDLAVDRPSPELPLRLAPAGAGLQIRAESLLEALRVLPESDPRREDLSDRLVGMAYWAAKEAYFDRDGDSCPAFGRPRDAVVPSGTAEPVDYPPADESARIQSNLFDHTGLITYGYRLTKDPIFLYIGRRIVGAFGTLNGPRCGTVNSVRQIYSPYNGFAAQGLMYADRHQTEFSIQFLNDDTASAGGLTVVNLGGGSYRISWTVPTDTNRYQLKYGPQIIVPNLNFNHQTRTYQYNPNAYDNFWAGNGGGVSNQPQNISTEPPPAAAGSVQSMTLNGLPAGSRFALKIFTTRDVSPSLALPSPPGGIRLQ